MGTRNIGEEFSNAVQKKINKNIMEKISGNILRIQEVNPKTKNPLIEIKWLAKGCYAFKMDYKPREIYMLKENTKVNDELLISVKDDKLTIYLIEMKSDSYKAAESQILYGKVYADFLIGILECEMKHTFKEKEYRGYIFTTGKTAVKRTTRRETVIECRKKFGIHMAKFDAGQKEFDFRALSLPVKDV